jgi:hypothetical protein
MYTQGLRIFISILPTQARFREACLSVMKTQTGDILKTKDEQKDAPREIL